MKRDPIALQRVSRLSLQLIFVIIVALGAGGLVKGATGMGLPIIALPILAALLSVPHAVAIVAIVGIAANAWQVWRYRDDLWQADFLPGLLLAGSVGIAGGTWLLTTLPERTLSLVLGLLLLGYVVLLVTKPHFALSRALGRKLAPAVGFGAGALQGATGISSPVGVTFIHALRLHRTAHIFAVSAMFLLFSLVHVPSLAVAGLLNWPILWQGVFAVLPAMLMMPVGSWLAERLSQKTFDRLVLGFLAIIGAQLFLQGLGFQA